MDSISAELQTKLANLSAQQQAQVANFVDALLREETVRSRPKMKLDWAGGLQHLRDQYTSVELQHAANQWREEDALAYLNQPENQ